MATTPQGRVPVLPALPAPRPHGHRGAVRAMLRRHLLLQVRFLLRERLVPGCFESDFKVAGFVVHGLIFLHLRLNFKI